MDLTNSYNQLNITYNNLSNEISDIKNTILDLNTKISILNPSDSQHLNLTNKVNTLDSSITPLNIDSIAVQQTNNKNKIRVSSLSSAINTNNAIIQTNKADQLEDNKQNASEFGSYFQ